MERPSRRTTAKVGAVIFWVVASVQPCMANLVGEGQLLAKRLCASCHMNEGQGEKSGSMGVPSFQAMANRRNQNHGHIVKWLRTKQSVMPDHKVTWHEADALAAYIMSLRQREAQ